MKTRFLLGILCLGLVSNLSATGPTPKSDLDTTETERMSLLPATQEATEQSVLPSEPILAEPSPEPAPPSSTDMSGVQPLPDTDAAPTGPSQDDLRKKAEAFRAVKTEAEEIATLADMRMRAFAAPTERSKRVQLREYYNAITRAMVKKSPDLKDLAEAWNYSKQIRLSRPRTEPDNVDPVRPSDYAENIPDSDRQIKKKSDGILPDVR